MVATSKIDTILPGMEETEIESAETRSRRLAKDATGAAIYSLVERLYPICRSITGNGVRDTLAILKESVPMEIHEVPTGTEVFDWTVPKEWNIRDAYIKDSSGRRVVDFRDSNLHVVNYSVPVRKKMSLRELRPYLHTLPRYPDRIPYRTTYYNRTWGFCMAHAEAEKLREDTYEVCIDSSLEDGHLTYGEFVVPGEMREEVLFSSHVCHPSMCNDNLSAVAVMAAVARQFAGRQCRYSYRFLFLPATIGPITWLSLNTEKTANIRHGLVGACLGDEGTIHYKRTRNGDAQIDRIVEKTLLDAGAPFRMLDFTPYGYDERQYGSPGFDLPVGCIMRTPHGEFPEYHTSADNLDFVKPGALEDSYRRICEIVDTIEANRIYRNTHPFGEPHLGKRGIYERLTGPNPKVDERSVFWVLNFSDGRHSLLAIALRSGFSFKRILAAAELLSEYGLLNDISGADD